MKILKLILGILIVFTVIGVGGAIMMDTSIWMSILITITIIIGVFIFLTGIYWILEFFEINKK